MREIFTVSRTIQLIISIFLILSCNNKEEKPLSAITDLDGNVYHSVIIGNQVWMVENLKTTKYNNGDNIGTTTPATLDISSESTPKYQWAYDGNESNVATYGRLYTWYTVTDSRKVYPSGWHVPSDGEWNTLQTYLGDENIIGGKLKEIGITHCLTPNTGATNESGFTALPGGDRNYNGTFGGIGLTGFWWSSIEIMSDAYFQGIGYNTSNLTVHGDDIGRHAFSVRCLRDKLMTYE